MKMFFLKNIPGKVPLFFLYKQDILQVNCMQNAILIHQYIVECRATRTTDKSKGRIVCHGGTHMYIKREV
jgi:hypothetical protein